MTSRLIAALAAAMFPFGALAQITGIFVPAQDGINSFQSADGTSTFSSTTATTGLWHERSIFEISGLPASGAYQGQDKSGALPTHNEVVTTISGLTVGVSYDVYMIMGVSVGATGDQHIDAGFTSGALATLTEGGGTDTGYSLAAGGSWKAYEQLIGSVAATDNGSGVGEVKVYVDATPNAERSVYHGLSYRVTPGPPTYVTESTLASPDGSLVFTLERSDLSNELAWSVTHDGRPVVTRGVLGVEISGVGVVGDEGTVAHVDSRSVDTTWTPPFGENSVIPEVFEEETLTLADPGHGGLTVRLQVRSYDEGVALRYLIDGSGTLTTTSERTSFPLPASTQVWVSSTAQGTISKKAIGAVSGAVERPLTAELATDLFIALGEAGLRDHARMKFSRSGATTLVPSLSGDSSHTDALVTPWRYVRAATSAAGLIQGNHFMLNLNDPSEVADPSWIRPGKVLREVTLTTQGGIACVDWAAAHNLDFILFDAGWYGPEGSASSDATTVTVDPARSPGPLDLPAVIAHADANGIGVILYVNHLALEAQLPVLLPLYQSWGVDGIKFGFVNVGSQTWTDWLHDSVAQCADHEIMANVHDEYRMTGVERTLPHFMTAEGIRGDETSAKNEQVLNTIFTRCLAGAGDQTNVYFAERVATMGSHASQLAKSVCIYSPWQYLFWYDRPTGSPGVGGAGSTASVLEDVPEMSFFERLPTVWDETRWLDGYPGTHATVARRSGDIWFVAALNGTTVRNFHVPLDFLSPGQNYRLEVFSDAPAVATTTQVRIDTSVIDRTHAIDRTVAVRNGFTAILTPTDDPLPPPPPPTTSLRFKHGADLVSDDGLVAVPGYFGGDDTSLVQETPDQNFGARPNLLVGVLGNGQVRDALLRYDLSAIAGKYASIESMALRLHVDAIDDPATSMVMKVGLERAGNADWVAGTGDGQVQDGSATWNHAVRSSTPWLGAANGARWPEDLHGIMASAVVSNGVTPVGSWLEIDLMPVAGDSAADTLTKVVDLWTGNGGADNAGLLLVYQSLTGYPQWSFSSCDHPDPALRPELRVEFTPLDPYGLWAEQVGLSAAGLADPNLDPDHDGLVNLLECLVGGEPLATNDADKLPVVTLSGDDFTFRYRVSPAGEHLISGAEFGFNLVDWQPVVAGSDGFAITPGPDDPDGTPTVQITIPHTLHPSLFLRLAVSTP